MDYFIYLETNDAGEVIDSVGIRKVTPQDRLLGIAPFPDLCPSPEIRQALKELIEQAQKEGLD